MEEKTKFAGNKVVGFGILQKYLMVTIFLLVAGILALSISFSINIQRIIHTESIIRLETLSSNLATNCKEMLISWDYPLLKEVCTGVLKQEDIVYITFYDDRGQIIGDSDYSRVGRKEPEIFNEIIQYDYSRSDHYTKKAENLFYIKKTKYKDKEVTEARRKLLIDDRLIGAMVLGASQKRTNEIIRKATIQVFVISIGILVLGVIVAFFFARTLTGPIKLLQVGAQKIGAGDLKYIINVNTSDEIGLLARAFNNMNHFLGSIQTAIFRTKSLTETLRRISEHLLSLSEEISAATQEVTSNISSVATNAEQQREHTVNSAKTIKDQANSLKEFIISLDEARNLARITHSTAEDGGRIIQSAIKKINLLFTIFDQNVHQVSELSGTIQEIDQVLEVITQIAEQTNLLALNAAIEAARAGDAGRGFAVVADEIKKLAEESGDATKQIGALVQRIQIENRAAVESMTDGAKHVTSGRESMTESEKSLSTIVKSVSNLEQRVANMSTLSSSQLERTDTVQSNMREVIAFAEDNASALEEIASSMEELNNSMAEITSSIQEISSASSYLQEAIRKMKV
ncbi:methyl-accepting chemotaxis protein [bacterium]|nr:methyl-accepting chemotaxis protein [bacterium]